MLTTTAATPSDETPKTVLSPAEARALLERMVTLVQQLSDGTIIVRREDGPIEKKLTIREQRARQLDTVFHGEARRSAPEQTLISNVQRTIDRLGLEQSPEPRRQRKERHLPPRRVYSAQAIRTAKTLDAIQHLPPAATSIIVYLAHHPRATVPEIVANLDLKRKTVVNALSLLTQKELAISEPYEGARKP